MKKLSFMLIMAFLFCSIQMVQAQTQPPQTRTRTNMDTIKKRTNMDTIKYKVDTMKNKWTGKDRTQTRTNPPVSDTTKTRNGVAVIPGGGVKKGQTIGHVGATGYKHHHKYQHHHTMVHKKTKHRVTKKPSGTEQPAPKQ